MESVDSEGRVVAVWFGSVEEIVSLVWVRLKTVSRDDGFVAWKKCLVVDVYKNQKHGITDVASTQPSASPP